MGEPSLRKRTAQGQVFSGAPHPQGYPEAEAKLVLYEREKRVDANFRPRDGDIAICVFPKDNGGANPLIDVHHACIFNTQKDRSDVAGYDQLEGMLVNATYFDNAHKPNQQNVKIFTAAMLNYCVSGIVILDDPHSVLDENRVSVMAAEMDTDKVAEPLHSSLLPVLLTDTIFSVPLHEDSPLVQGKQGEANKPTNVPLSYANIEKAILDTVKFYFSNSSAVYADAANPNRKVAPGLVIPAILTNDVVATLLATNLGGGGGGLAGLNTIRTNIPDDAWTRMRTMLMTLATTRYRVGSARRSHTDEGEFGGFLHVYR